jgi:hypothetical protein
VISPGQSEVVQPRVYPGCKSLDICVTERLLSSLIRAIFQDDSVRDLSLGTL